MLHPPVRTVPSRSQAIPRYAMFTTFLRRLLVLCALVLGLTAQGHAAERSPLIQEGKKTLFQRVVTHPAARLLQSPEAAAPVVQADIRPFTVLYVYGRKDGWLEVGPLGAGPKGWLAAASATDWNQSLTLLFTQRSGRDPVLFFKNEKDLADICSANDMQARLTALHTSINAARAGNADAALPVIATEPPDQQGAVAAERFYLMPILNMEDPFEGLKFLKVASIDPGNAGKDAAPSGPPRTAIAFVIDTTISMKPYIDQSLNVIRSIYDQVEKDKLGNDVAFAVVAFRNSTEAAKGLEYTATVISDFATADNRKALETELAKVQEAKASSHSFAEDSPAGIKTALDQLSWGPYSTRVLMVISDAGPLPASDKYASVKMDMPELADYARAKGVWITAVHVKSSGGQKDHASAEKAYRVLTRLSDNRSNYQAVPAPTPAEGAKNFAAVAKALTSGVVNMVRQTLAGKLVTRPAAEAAKPGAAPASPEMEAQRMAEALGYAMQLEYLGQQRKNRAPSVVDAWIADMDLNQMAQDKHVPTVEVAVLLTKNQLNDLSKQISIIIDNAERTKKTDSRDFFQGILSASARMARDPNAPTGGQNLAQLGVLAEFLDGLPYKSDIMLLREEDWYRMSVGEQTAFVNRLKSRLARYEEYDKDRAHWESFGAANAGDWMYRVPLTMLP